MTGQNSPKLLDQVRNTLRLKRYAIRTEEAYAGWITRFIRFHNMRHPQEMGTPEIEAFLTRLARQKVAASTVRLSSRRSPKSSLQRPALLIQASPLSRVARVYRRYAGQMYFLLISFPLTRVRPVFAAITLMKVACAKPSGEPPNKPPSTNRLAPLPFASAKPPCGTVSPRTYWKTAMTFAPRKPCSNTKISEPQ